MNKTAIQRLLALITGGILIRVAFTTHLRVTQTTPLFGGLSQLVLYATGLLLILVAVSEIDIDRWMPHLTVATLVGVALALVSHLVVAGIVDSAIGSDSLLFSQYGGELLLEGKNPYAHSMNPAFEGKQVAGNGSATVSGGRVNQFPYPIGAALAFLPQLIVFGTPTNGNVTLVILFMLMVGFLISETPQRYALAPIAVLFATPRLMGFSSGGVNDILWILPVLVSMYYWHEQKLLYAGLAFGIAATLKQQPWFIGPFLLVWLYNESDNFRADLFRFVGVAIGVFALFNLPFFLLNPVEYIQGVGVVFGLSDQIAVMDGSGVSILATSMGLPLSRTVFTILTVLMMLLLLTLYHRQFENMKWFGWIAPAFFLFFSHRSMHNYFLFIIPVAYLAVLYTTDGFATYRRTQQDNSQQSQRQSPQD